MYVSGKYDTGGLKTIPCVVEIKKGLIEVFGDGVRQPKERNVFELKRTDGESGLMQTTNYFVRYVKNDDEEQVVYVNLSGLQLSKIKYQRRELFFQKMTPFEKLASVVFIVAINILSSFLYDAIANYANKENAHNKNNIITNAPTVGTPSNQKLNSNSITPDSIENLSLSPKDSFLTDTTINL